MNLLASIEGIASSVHSGGIINNVLLAALAALAYGEIITIAVHSQDGIIMWTAAHPCIILSQPISARIFQIKIGKAY